MSTTYTRLNDKSFDHLVSLEEKALHEAQIAANEAFIKAMARAARKGREHVRPGIFVDTTPPTQARRIRGEVTMSCTGSPAAMCVEIGARGDGAATLK